METVSEVEKYYEDGKSYHNMARELKCKQHLYKAIECFEQAILIDPNCVEAHRRLSFCYADLRDNTKALEFEVKANKIENAKK